MPIGMEPYDLTGLTTDPKFASLQAVRDKKIGIIPTGVQIWGNNTLTDDQTTRLLTAAL